MDLPENRAISMVSEGPMVNQDLKMGRSTLRQQEIVAGVGTVKPYWNRAAQPSIARTGIGFITTVNTITVGATGLATTMGS
jgi:hypothetical protein